MVKLLLGHQFIVRLVVEILPVVLVMYGDLLPELEIKLLLLLVLGGLLRVVLVF